MDSGYVYDVTKWNGGDAHKDIGEVINQIIADIKARQVAPDTDKGGKPGAVIYIPPGDYPLHTQVVIDISYLKIMGSGHGFTSSSIRFNASEKEWADWHEVWPGGSRILVELSAEADNTEENRERAGAAFYVKREGNPRLSSVEFEGFCIDGLHFIDDGSGKENPENTYINGKTGIYAESANDSFRITGMGFVYLEHGITMYHSDALNIHDNFIAECGNCIELRGWGQASKITDNFIGAGYRGYSIYAENFGALLVTANNVFPRGASSLCFDGVTRSVVTGNRFHSFYPGMLVFRGNCLENLVSSNHFLRDHEPWPPMQMYDNGLDDLYGLLYIDGSYNSVIGNHISEVMDRQHLIPAGIKPVIIRVASGEGNYISNNYIVASSTAAEANVFGTESGSCYSMQVEALLSAQKRDSLAVTAVQIEQESVHNTVLDSGSEQQVVLDKTVNAFRATPCC